jgi:hypothetical protein
MMLADVIEIPGIRQRARADFPLVRGARAEGYVEAVGSTYTYGAGGLRVQFLAPSNLEKVAETRTSWGGDPSSPEGTYELAVPAGTYLLRFSPTTGSAYLDSGYYRAEAEPLTQDPGEARVIVLKDWDQKTFDFSFHVFPRTIGDIDLDGKVEHKDLMLLTNCWLESPVLSDTAIKANLFEDDVIDHRDLLTLVKLARWSW